jgi:hypothetical protein
MLLLMEYYSLGLGLLGFTAHLAYVKLKSMGLAVATVAAAVTSGITSLAIDLEWGTVIMWGAMLTFVSLCAVGKLLRDYVNGAPVPEPPLPSWLIQQQQQQLFSQAQQQQQQETPLAAKPAPQVQFAFEEEAEAEEGDLPPMHHNLAAFARNQPGFGPASNTFGMQTGWPQGPTSFHSQPMWVQPPGGTVPQTMSQMLSSQPAQCFPPLPPSGSRGQAPVAPGGTNGFTEDELHKLATNEKWTGLPSSFKRAAGEIYQLMRSSGFGSVREWFQSSWLGAPDTQQKRDLFHTATLCDMRIAEYTQSQGANGLAWALSHDDMLEGMLRQLSAAKEYHLTGDSAQASRIIAFRTGNDSVLPSWLQSETREFPNAVHKQELRARPSATKRNADGGPYPKAKAKAKGGQKGQPPANYEGANT